MTRFPELPAIAVVSTKEDKARAVADSLPRHRVLWVYPSGPQEEELSAWLPFDHERSEHISVAKAKNWTMDLAGIVASLFNDVTRIAGDTILERPNHIHELIDQIMAQSGTQVVIRSTFTATAVAGMHSVTIDSIFHTAAYTRREIENRTGRDGSGHAMNVSGGLPVEWVELFDRTKPIMRQFSANGKITVLPAIPWSRVDQKMQRSLTTGAFSEPLQHLVNAVQ